MLKHLTIHNLALIRDLNIDFTPELNVFSGETGAGKSIIVDSLMLLVGARYDKSMLKYGEDSGYVEGVFDFSDGTPLESLGIDTEDGIFIVTRRFYRDGKNDIRVNGKQVTTSMLRELMSSYADIYGQNEYQSLLKITEQRKILDHYVFKNDPEPLSQAAAVFAEYKSTLKELGSLGDERARAQRADVLHYQIQEIADANVKPGEEDTLLERRHLLMASERIKNSLAEAIAALDGDGGASSSVSDALHAMNNISSFGEEFSALYGRLRSASIELDDITESIKEHIGGLDGSERELDELNNRLDKLRALKSKYGSYDAMQKFLADARAELSRLEKGEELYTELLNRVTKMRSELYKCCKKLSQMRRNGAESLASRIVNELADLGMANSSFVVQFNEQPQEDGFEKNVTSSGFDEFEFYLSPNVGQPLLPLAKIISGGEMSRFMLAIKLIIGNLGSIDTMIFDEIDAGISGETGLCVAKKLAELARGKQVLCVTHLAQIAAMADGHYFIEKHESGGDTITTVTQLDRGGMIGEISRLSGTKGVSGTSDKNAAELKAWSDSYKASL